MFDIASVDSESVVQVTGTAPLMRAAPSTRSSAAKPPVNPQQYCAYTRTGWLEETMSWPFAPVPKVPFTVVGETSYALPGLIVEVNALWSVPEPASAHWTVTFAGLAFELGLTIRKPV